MRSRLIGDTVRNTELPAYQLPAVLGAPTIPAMKGANAPGPPGCCHHAHPQVHVTDTM